VSHSSDGRRWGLEERVSFLSGVPLFGGLAPDMVRAVAQHFGVKPVERGGFVFLEGDRATSLNGLAEGRVKVIRENDEGREVILRQIDPGEIFGGAGGWGSATYPASARAQEQGHRITPACGARQPVDGQDCDGTGVRLFMRSRPTCAGGAYGRSHELADESLTRHEADGNSGQANHGNVCHHPRRRKLFRCYPDPYYCQIHRRPGGQGMADIELIGG
jgi:Cyclic nucleotide-binding domain